MTTDDPVENLTNPKRSRVYIAGALAGIGLSVLAMVYLSENFAKASDVETLTQRTVVVEKDVGELRSDQKNDAAERHRLEEDYHFQRDQLWEIAKRVGAPQLPAPKH